VKKLSIHTDRWFRGNENFQSAGYCVTNAVIPQSKPIKGPGYSNIDMS
jgi:hypothetical protein